MAQRTLQLLAPLFAVAFLFTLGRALILTYEGTVGAGLAAIVMWGHAIDTATGLAVCAVGLALFEAR